METADTPQAALRNALRRAALITTAVVAIGLLNFSIAVTSWRAEGNPQSAKFAFVWEMTGALTLLPFLPLLLPLMDRFRLGRRTLWRYLPLHLASFSVFAVGHTLAMWASRSVIYHALGWGTYHYGDMRYRFFMEGGKQFIGYWAAYTVVAAIAYARDNREREVAAARLERQLTDARLQALKMQLNPHFLFNALNLISAHVQSDPHKADAMIVHLSDFLRMTLRHAETQEVPLETELEFLTAYLEIMRARFEDRLVVDLQVADEARAGLVPHLVLQPLVENAIAHALARDGAQARLRLVAGRSGAHLRLVLEDNGPGLAPSAAERRGLGVGLRNTTERLRRLYGADQRLEISEPAEGGVRLEIEVPYRRAAPDAARPA
jgi:two-component system LytT family sensor kinase